MEADQKFSESETAVPVRSLLEKEGSHQWVRTLCSRRPTCRFTFHILRQRAIRAVYTNALPHSQWVLRRLSPSFEDEQSQSHKFWVHC
jgi:hypothetical protein